MRGLSVFAGWVLVILGALLMISPIPFGFLIIGAGSAMLAAVKKGKGAHVKV